jgi:Tol biopolymer transport system component
VTRDRSVDERISAWLLEEAPSQIPDRVLQATFERTRANRQRRTYLGWRSFPIRISPAAIVVGAAAIVLLVAGIALLPRSNPSVGGRPSPSPSPPPTPQIAFERTVDGNTDIYLMNLDRTGLVRLTTDPAVDTEPGWSPDGQRIAFTRGTGLDRDVFLMNADGTEVTRLTNAAEGTDRGPAFSRDGSQIAFQRYVDPTLFDLYVIDVDGSNERRVFHQDNVYADGPQWALDGQTLYFTKDPDPAGGLDVVRLDLTTDQLTTIAADPGDDSGIALSPDGSTIAFQSDRAPGGIFLMDVDGSNVRHVTGSWTDGSPISWSPDGLQLVYSLPDGSLYLVNTDGSEVIKWTEGGLGVAWRPGS